MSRKSYAQLVLLSLLYSPLRLRAGRHRDKAAEAAMRRTFMALTAGAVCGLSMGITAITYSLVWLGVMLISGAYLVWSLYE